MCGSILIFATFELGSWPVLMSDEVQIRLEIQIVENKVLPLTRVDSQEKQFPVFCSERINLLQYL